jgi:hypothetical protein
LISRSRLVVTLGLVMALGVATLAFADGASEATPGVIGKLKPTNLGDVQKPVQLELGVTTDIVTDGTQSNPEKEIISIGENVGWKSKAAKYCTAPLNGTTTEQAKAACPKASVISKKGEAEVELSESNTVTDIVVTVFNTGKNKVSLHAYSETLTATNTQVVLGKIKKSPDGKKFDRALFVNDAPDAGGDAFAITEFKATISKGSGVALASCESSKFPVKRTVTYDDGSKESVTETQKLGC